MNDHKDVALVLDMRSEKQFAHCSLDKSANLPIEKFTEDIFINWAKHSKKLEVDTSIFKTKRVQNEFKRRRRYWVYIIAAHDSKNLNKTLLELSNFANKDGLVKLIEMADSDQKKEDLLSLRNALLLYKALKLERLREMDICIDGFDKMPRYYRHFCLDDKGQLMVARP